MTKNTKKSFHETVAENLIEQLKQGTAPWQKPWQPGDPVATLPMNPTTGKRYRGINTLNLMSQPHTDPRWLTYKQAANLGAQVRKGEKSTLVQYWKFNDEHIRTDANGNPVLNSDGKPIKEQVRLERPRVFYAAVFNAQQMDSLPALAIQAPDWDPIARAEEILRASNAVIHHGEHDRAFYRPSTDSIHLPHKHQFLTPDRYYATVLHELGRQSGHESRLNRDIIHPFGSEGYAKEELRAEIASMLLGSELGIGHDASQHVAYVGTWIKVLQQDPNEIFRAAADAEKIMDYVLSFSQQQGLAAQEAIKMEQIKQQSATYTSKLSPDLASVATQNIAAFKALTAAIKDQEFNAIQLIAEARKFYMNGSIDNLEFEEVAEGKLGFRIPANWCGAIQVQGCVIQKGENGSESIVPADSLNVEPQFYGVYARSHDNTLQWLKDVELQQEAVVLAERLTLIDAASEKNEYEKAAKLASIHENRVRQDPHSTTEDVALAKEARKSAEFMAMNKDQARQNRSKEMENKPSDTPKQDEPLHQKKQSKSPNDSRIRQYLVVPYKEKDQAKAAGASWDNTAKSWFVGDKADIRALQRWLPENVSSQQGPMMDPQAEFAELLRAQGCMVDGNHPVMDSTKQRIQVEGDKPSEKSGFYVAHLDGHPAGYFKDNRSGQEIRWKAKGYALSDAQKAALKAEAAIKQQNRKAEQHEQQLSVAAAIKELLAIAPLADSEHPYLLDKNARPGDLKMVPQNADDLPDDSMITIAKDRAQAKVLRETNPDSIVLTAGDLLMSAQDIDGHIWSAQTIQPGGAKYFVTGSRKENNFHLVGSKNQGPAALDATPVIVIAEGYATADTLSQALTYPVVAAFDSGNLSKVAQDLRDRYPFKPIIIAGDDDYHQEVVTGNNPGKEKALEAAQLVGGFAVFATFASGEQVSQKLSDFNDLANKSVLGVEGVLRQVGSAVKKALEQARDQDKVEKLQIRTKNNQQEKKQKRALAR